MNRSSDNFDVAIAGGGPAGSSAAIRLAQGGLRVVLIEQKRFPREKLCGEFISPECLAHFDDLGVDLASGSPIEEAKFFTRSGRALAVPARWLGISHSGALGLSRGAMDKALIDRARAVGVDVREGTTVKSVICADGKVTGLLARSAETETPIAAAMTIDARGRTKPLLDTSGQSRSAAKYVAFKAHLAGALTASSTCEMFVYRGGYGGCLPIENGLHNLCFIAPAADLVKHGSDPERYLRTVLMTNRRAAETLQNAKVAGEWHAVPVQDLGPRDPIPAPGLLAIGDAAGFIDPFTGSGILLALQSGALAARAIKLGFADHLSIEREYRRSYDLTFSKRFRTSSLLRSAFRSPAIAEVALTLLGSSDRLLRRLALSTRSESTADA